MGRTPPTCSGHAPYGSRWGHRHVPRRTREPQESGASAFPSLRAARPARRERDLHPQQTAWRCSGGQAGCENHTKAGVKGAIASGALPAPTIQAQISKTRSAQAVTGFDDSVNPDLGLPELSHLSQQQQRLLLLLSRPLQATQQ
ncbi:unnamed protein product [Lampetra fluviatilis]